MTLDLHGYTVPEALDLFVTHYNSQVGRGDLSRFQVIHGWGSGGSGGRIRTALRKLLSFFQEELSLETDPVNPGITWIIPSSRLPEGAGFLYGEILDYCGTPRTEGKILGRYRRHGDLRVKNALRRLESAGKLARSRKGRHTVYAAT